VNRSVRFFVSLHKFGAGILTYFKENLCKITENMQASRTQGRQGGIVRYCLKSLQRDRIDFRKSLFDFKPADFCTSLEIFPLRRAEMFSGKFIQKPFVRDIGPFSGTDALRGGVILDTWKLLLRGFFFSGRFRSASRGQNRRYISLKLYLCGFVIGRIF